MGRSSVRTVAGVILTLALIGTTSTPVFAAKWWSSNQLFWTAGPACRDGVVVQGRDFFPGFEVGHEYPFQARLYDGQFDSYPMFLDEYEITPTPDIDPTKLSAPIGSLVIVKPELHAAPLVYADEGAPPVFENAGATEYTFDYDVGTLFWRGEQPVGAAIAVAWDAKLDHVVVEVEDCYLAPDAADKRAALLLQATVGTGGSVCTADTALVADPGDEIYACLVLENTGDVTFTGHSVAAAPYAMDGAPGFTLTPGERISLTHALAEEAGLDLDLGPFTDALDVVNEVTWTASGEGRRAADAAYTTVVRNSPGRVYLPVVLN